VRGFHEKAIFCQGRGTVVPRFSFRCGRRLRLTAEAWAGQGRDGSRERSDPLRCSRAVVALVLATAASAFSVSTSWPGFHSHSFGLCRVQAGVRNEDEGLQSLNRTRWSGRDTRSPFYGSVRCSLPGSAAVPWFTWLTTGLRDLHSLLLYFQVLIAGSFTLSWVAFHASRAAFRSSRWVW